MRITARRGCSLGTCVASGKQHVEPCARPPGGRCGALPHNAIYAARFEHLSSCFTRFWEPPGEGLLSTQSSSGADWGSALKVDLHPSTSFERVCRRPATEDFRDPRPPCRDLRAPVSRR